MPFEKLAAQKVKPGKTVELVLNQLTSPHGAPIIAIEHLGESNRQWWGDQIARAKASSAIRTSKKAKDDSISEEAIAAARMANRETLATYSVRHLVRVFHDDGTQATDDDIKAFVMSIPDDVIDSIISHATDPNIFRDVAIEGVPADIAKK